LQGYDEPEILSSSIRRICLIGADAGQTWAKTKTAAAGARGFTLDLLKEIAKGLIKKKIGNHTGIKL
jgi:hypothetical protein